MFPFFPGYAQAYPPRGIGHGANPYRIKDNYNDSLIFVHFLLNFRAAFVPRHFRGLRMVSLWMPRRHKLGIENFPFSIFTPFYIKIAWSLSLEIRHGKIPETYTLSISVSRPDYPAQNPAEEAPLT